MHIEKLKKKIEKSSQYGTPFCDNLRGKTTEASWFRTGMIHTYGS